MDEGKDGRLDGEDDHRRQLESLKRQNRRLKIGLAVGLGAFLLPTSIAVGDYADPFALGDQKQVVQVLKAENGYVVLGSDPAQRDDDQDDDGLARCEELIRAEHTAESVEDISFAGRGRPTASGAVALLFDVRLASGSLRYTCTIVLPHGQMILTQAPRPAASRRLQ